MDLDGSIVIGTSLEVLVTIMDQGDCLWGFFGRYLLEVGRLWSSIQLHVLCVDVFRNAFLLSGLL